MEEISKSIKKLKTKIAIFIVLQILLFMYYFWIGKYDWDYGFDLPYRIVFEGISSLIAGVFFGLIFYLLGKSKEYENDKILKLPIFFIILSMILLFRIDIMGVIKLCFFNGLFILGIFRSKIEIRSYLSKVSKIILWFVVMYFLIPIYILFFPNAFMIFFAIIESIFRIDKSFSQYITLISFFITNFIFGFFIKKYFDKEEIEVVRILTISGCLIIMGIFIFMGFNWYKEDYHAIIYTFPYKVLMYFEEGENSVEKFGIIKTLESRYFVYAMIVNMGFYLGTLKINNKNKRKNCVENKIDGDI